MIHTSFQIKRQSGLSLVELMVAVAIGLLLLAGLTLIFVNSSRASRELQLTAQQIENGRYAIDILTQDLRLAGFYGHFHELPAPPGTLPDPCDTSDVGALRDALALPVQGYRAANLSALPNFAGAYTCNVKGMPAANLRPGSDVLVIRRADTTMLRRPGQLDPNGNPYANLDVNGDLAVAGLFYLQASATQAEVQIGNGNRIGANNKADGGASTILYHDGSAPAPIRRLRTHIYFVAPCSLARDNGGNIVASGICTGSNAEDRIPTLKRLEWRPCTAAQPCFTGATAGVDWGITALVEGIEYLKIEYGIDNQPTTVNAETGLAGNSTVDVYVAAPASPAEWSQAIAARVFVLARNTEITSDFTDDKTYNLGTAVVGPADYATSNRFRRHVYAAAVRFMNSSGRREIP
jgi:type IV pilus assembly protein PilW